MAIGDGLELRARIRERGVERNGVREWNLPSSGRVEEE